MELLDVIVLVMLKTMSYGIFMLRDSFISKTVRGILINLLPTSTPTDSSSSSNHQPYILLHPFISERMMRTMLLYCKKAVKEYESAMKRLADTSSNDSFVVVQKHEELMSANPMSASRLRSDSQASLDSSQHSTFSQSNRRAYNAPHSMEGLVSDKENFVGSRNTNTYQQEEEEVRSEKLILALREGIVTLLEIVSTILR